MSIGRAIAEHIAEQDLPPHTPPGGGPDKIILPILRDGIASIYPDVVDFVDTEFRASAQDKDKKSEGLAYGVVSDILAPRYGGEARVASVVFDFANRIGRDETETDQEFRFELAFSTILNILSVLPEGMREVSAYPYQDPNNPDETLYRFNYKVSSLQVTDSARILISAGFMRGYIIVDVGYTLGVNDGKG